MSYNDEEPPLQKSDTRSRLRFTVEETSDENIVIPYKGGDSENETAFNKIVASNQTLEFSSTEEEQDIEYRKRKKRKSSPPILLFSIGVAIVWIIGAIVYMSQNLVGKGQIDVLSMIITLLAPAAFSVLAGMLGESVNRSSQQSRALVNAARRMMEPEKNLNSAAKSSLQSVREEISRLEASLSSATDKLGDLENTIEIRAASLRKASEEARGGADRLVSTMENEQNRLSALLNALTELTNTAQQTTKLATQGFDEKAAKLTQAAEILAQNSNAASESASEAAQKLDAALNKTLQAISGLDQSSERGELALTRAHDLMVMARARADDAVGGVEEVIAALRYESENAKAAAAESLSNLEQTSAAIHKLSEDAAEYLNKQLKDNSSRIENMRQSSFEINQDADKFAAARLKDSQDLILNSTALLNEAGDKINERFAQVAIACSDQARAIEDLIDGLNSRLETLPQEAKARAEAVEEALGQTLDRFNVMGRKAAEDARQLDEAFQSRLKESYSALGEVMQKLGAFAGTFTPHAGLQPNIEPRAILSEPSVPNKKPEEIAILETPKFEPLPPIQIGNIFSKTSDMAPTKESIAKPIVEPTVEPSVAPIIEHGLEPSSKPSAKPIVEPITEPKKPETKFNSVLSPVLAVRSVRQDSSVNPIPNLRGKISQSDDFDKNTATIKQDIPAEAALKAPNTASIQPVSHTSKSAVEPAAPIEAKSIARPIKEPSHDDDPFADASFRSSTISHSSSNDWNWRDVLSAIDQKKSKQKLDHSLQIISELELDKAISSVVLDRLALAYVRDTEKGRIQTNLAIPRHIAKLKQLMERDIELRSFVVRFVEERHESAMRGRLHGNEMRLYLAGRAALD